MRVVERVGEEVGEMVRWRWRPVCGKRLEASQSFQQTSLDGDHQAPAAVVAGKPLHAHQQQKMKVQGFASFSRIPPFAWHFS